MAQSNPSPQTSSDSSPVQEMYSYLRSPEFKADSLKAIQDDLAKPAIYSPGYKPDTNA